MSDLPRWICGDPRGRGVVVTCALRDVGEGVFVGSAGARFDPTTGLAVGERALRRPFYDGDLAPPEMLDEVARWCAGEPRVLVQCQAGLSRSASVAYALLRARGVGHAEALRRVEVRVPHHDRDEAFPRRETLESCVAWARARYGR